MLPTPTVWDPAPRGATILWGQLTSVFLPPARVLGFSISRPHLLGALPVPLANIPLFSGTVSLSALAGFLPPAQTPASLSPSLSGGAPFTRLICKERNDTPRRALARRLNERRLSAKLP